MDTNRLPHEEDEANDLPPAASHLENSENQRRQNARYGLLLTIANELGKQLPNATLQRLFARHWSRKWRLGRYQQRCNTYANIQAFIDSAFSEFTKSHH